MKKTIRRCVFETNSSSTHSLTIKKTNGEKEEASFEIKSAFAKLKWLIGHVNHAEDELKDNLIDLATSIEKLKSDLISKAKNILNSKPESEVYLLRKNKKFESYSFADLDGFLSYADDQYPTYHNDIVFELHARESVMKLKECFIEAYCQLENLTKEEVIKKLQCNDCANCSLYCEDFFQEGPMDGCSCGFSSFIDLDKNLKKFNTISTAQKFLSEEYTILAKEYVNFMDFYISDKVY